MNINVELNIPDDDILSLFQKYSETMKTNEIITIDLKYNEVERIFKSLLFEDINVKLCEDSLQKGINKRKEENADKK